jgi:hypothetical protein
LFAGKYEFEFGPRGAGHSPGPEFDSGLRKRAYLNPPGATGIGTVNTVAWQDAELPSANLHAGASDIARVCDALLCNAPPIVDEGVLREATMEASAGEDLVLARPSRSGSVSNSPSRSARLARIRGASDISAAAALSDLPTPTRTWRSHT